MPDYPLKKVSGTTVLDSGTVTLSTGSTPALDTIIPDVSTDENASISDVALGVNTPPSANTDYAFNADWGQQWDDSDGAVDVALTVNWDNDPGEDITLDYEVRG